MPFVKEGNHITAAVGVFFVLVAYITSVFSLGNPQDGINECIKYLCLPAGIMLSALGDGDDKLDAVFFAAAFLAVISIPECAGALVRQAQPHGYLGYANVTAAVLACGIISGAYALKRKRNAFRIVMLIVTAAVFLSMNSAACALILVAVLSGVLAVTSERGLTVRVCAAVCLAAVAGMIIAAALAFIRPDIAPTVAARISYSRDALRLFSLRPWSGTGIASWESVQTYVHSSDYFVRAIHNSPLQLFVEGGVFTVLPLLALLFFSVYRLIKGGRADVFAAFIVIFIAVHSLTDVDFGYGIVFFILGFMMNVRCPKVKGLRPVVAVLLGGAVIYSSIELYYALSFEKCFENREYTQAIAYIEKKIILCPLDSGNYKNKAVTLKKMGAEDGKISESIKKASELSPYNPVYYRDMLELCEPDSNELFDICINYILSDPHNTEVYQYTDVRMRKTERYEEFLNKIHEIAEKNDVTLPNDTLRKYLK